MYKSLEQALLDLEKAGMLKRIHAEVDPHLEMAEIARENFRQGGPALHNGQRGRVASFLCVSMLE